MPNVPNVPGVPAMAAYGAFENAITVVSALALLFGNNSGEYGIFLDGEPAFDYASTITFEFSQDYFLSKYSIEGGGFQSYDKVQEPYDLKATITSGSTAQERSQLIHDIREAAASIDIYDVFTPDAIFLQCNIHHVDFRQSADRGIGRVIAHVYLTEIRLSTATSFTDTKQPGDSGQTGVGSVQPEEPTALTSQSFFAFGGAK